MADTLTRLLAGLAEQARERERARSREAVPGD
jgi:hypothetical protein